MTRAVVMYGFAWVWLCLCCALRWSGPDWGQHHDVRGIADDPASILFRVRMLMGNVSLTAQSVESACALLRHVCRTVMVMFRIGQVASIGSFLLNLIGAVMVFQLSE
jgi:hypothetical protein